MLLYGVSQELRPDQTETVNNVLTPTFGSMYGTVCVGSPLLERFSLTT